MEGCILVHCHSKASLTDGLACPSELARAAQCCHMSAMALTDCNSLAAIPEFVRVCQCRGIKPLAGCDVCVQHAPYFDYDSALQKGLLVQACNTQPARLVLLARDNIGYHNLIKLVSRPRVFCGKGLERVPIHDERTLRHYARGLICLSGGWGGEIPNAVLRGDMAAAEWLAKLYASIYPGNFYLEMLPPIPGDDAATTDARIVNSFLGRMAARLQLPVVAGYDCRYLGKENTLAFTTLRELRAADNCAAAPWLGTPQEAHRPLLRPEWQQGFFCSTPEAMHNAQGIVDVCDVDWSREFFPDTITRTDEPLYLDTSGSDVVAALRRMVQHWGHEHIALVVKPYVWEKALTLYAVARMWGIPMSAGDFLGGGPSADTRNLLDSWKEEGWDVETLSDVCERLGAVEDMHKMRGVGVVASPVPLDDLVPVYRWDTSLAPNNDAPVKAPVPPPLPPLPMVRQDATESLCADAYGMLQQYSVPQMKRWWRLL